jgi:serine/threonine protein kinase
MSQTPSAPSQWSLPISFDGYRVLMTLGEGARSQVCLGHDTVLDRPVVIRFLNIPPSDAAAREHFFSEARVAARIQHPNVMTVYRVGEVGGRCYLISEYVQGQLLSTVTKPMAARSTLHCALGMARGLAAAHRRGILHRDLKPSNVVLSDEGEVKLLDFGLVDFLDAGSVAVARSSVSNPPVPAAESMSSPAVLADSLASTTAQGSTAEAYRAPELRRGGASPRADVYSLGAVLYELCTGTAPTLASSQSQRPLGERMPELDRRFAAIIERCLTADPGDRYASGAEVLDALELLAPWAAADTLPEGNPYRGLLPFEAEHRGLFFGRRAEIGTLMRRQVLAVQSWDPAPCHRGRAGRRTSLARGIDGAGTSPLARARDHPAHNHRVRGSPA